MSKDTHHSGNCWCHMRAPNVVEPGIDGLAVNLRNLGLRTTFRLGAKFTDDLRGAEPQLPSHSVHGDLSASSESVDRAAIDM